MTMSRDRPANRDMNLNTGAAMIGSYNTHNAGTRRDHNTHMTSEHAGLVMYHLQWGCSVGFNFLKIYKNMSPVSQDFH